MLPWLAAVVMPQRSYQLRVSASCCVRYLFLRKCTSQHLSHTLYHKSSTQEPTHHPTFIMHEFHFDSSNCAFVHSHCVYEVSVLQEYDAASLGDWLPVADT
jgi:hypothetical protein